MKSILKNLFRLLSSRPAPSSLRAKNSFRPMVEPLEERAVPALFTVTNTVDNGDNVNIVIPGSLRWAILQANQHPGLDTITFNITDTQKVQTIRPLVQLPDITDKVVIDGYTEFGASSNTLAHADNAKMLIVLDGSLIKEEIAHPPEHDRGLHIVASNCVVTGLVIQNFDFGAGIEIDGNNNLIHGNFIGTDALGTIRQINWVGIRDRGQNNIIGGSETWDRNLISGNSWGVIFENTTGGILQGNFIGTDFSGQLSLENGEGVLIESSSNILIGGATKLGQGNVISGNYSNGIEVAAAGWNTIQGNFIGVTADSDHSKLGNGKNGIEVDFGSVGTVIGLPNVNYNAPRPSPGPAGTPSTPYAANLIAYNGRYDSGNNGGDGVAVEDAIGTTIRGNAIYMNSLLGIDLRNSYATIGVTPNDVGDGDDGANHLQNFPVLASATSSNVGTTIVGTLNSNPGKFFTVDLYANPTPSAGHLAQGKQYLGQMTVKTDAQGNATFSFITAKQLPAGTIFTATATDSQGNTSEFSAGIVQAQAANGLQAGGPTELRQSFGLDESFQWLAANLLFQEPAGVVSHLLPVSVPDVPDDRNFSLKTAKADNRLFDALWTEFEPAIR